MRLPYNGSYPVTWTFADHKANGGITADYAGTDFGLPYGTPLYATEAGEAFYSTSGGEPYIVLYGATGAWFYVHVSGFVKWSGYFNEGDLIGYSGYPVSIGSGAHLHLGLQRGGIYVDPFPFLFNTVITKPENMEQQIYTIRPGDTLGDIANRLGLTTDQLISWNGISNPDIIFAGNQIIYYTNPVPQVNSAEIQDLNQKLKEAENKIRENENKAVKEKEQIKADLEAEYNKKIADLKLDIETNKATVIIAENKNKQLEKELEAVNKARKFQLSVSPHWTEEDKVVLKKVSQNLAVRTLAIVSEKIKNIPRPFRILFYMMSGSLILALGASLADFDYVAFASQYKAFAIPITVFFTYFGNTFVTYLTDLGERFKKIGEEESKSLLDGYET